MGNCRDCKWWRSARHGHHDARIGWAVCDLHSVGDVDGAWRHNESLAEPSNCCGWYSEFMTAPDFGCVQFEARAA